MLCWRERERQQREKRLSGGSSRANVAGTANTPTGAIESNTSSLTAGCDAEADHTRLDEGRRRALNRAVRSRIGSSRTAAGLAPKSQRSGTSEEETTLQQQTECKVVCKECAKMLRRCRLQCNGCTSTEGGAAAAQQENTRTAGGEAKRMPP